MPTKISSSKTKATSLVVTALESSQNSKSSLERESKVFLITSIHPGEGKTFTSKNLASIYARSGKKVVLIDFEARCRTISPAKARELLNSP